MQNKAHFLFKINSIFSIFTLFVDSLSSLLFSLMIDPNLSKEFHSKLKQNMIFSFSFGQGKYRRSESILHFILYIYTQNRDLDLLKLIKSILIQPLKIFIYFEIHLFNNSVYKRKGNVRIVMKFIGVEKYLNADRNLPF